MIVQPTNLTVFAGSAAIFSAFANGTPPLAYHWQRNSTNLFDVGNLSGVTNNILVIMPASTNDNGSYSLVVTNAYGSITSSIVVLTVDLVAADITLASSTNPSGYNDSVHFIASVTPTNATGTVQFLTNGAAFDTQAIVAGQAVSTNVISLPRGTNFVTAIYSGDENDLPATNTLEQIVTNHPPIAAAAFYIRTAVYRWRLPLPTLPPTGVMRTATSFHWLMSASAPTVSP